MNVKIKVSNKKCLPVRGSEQAAGYDIRYHGDITITIPPRSRRSFPTGVFLEIEQGHYSRVAPRSGLSFKQGIFVIEGTIDSDYRGQVHVLLYNSTDEPFSVIAYDRIAQLIFQAYETPDFEVVNTLESDTARGEKGFGHTGFN